MPNCDFYCCFLSFTFYIRLIYFVFSFPVLFDVEFDCKMLFAQSIHRRPISTW